MKIGVVVGTRYSRVGEQYYTYTSYHSDMWKEYISVFEEVVLLDRVNYEKKVPTGQKPVLVEGVEFIEYPSCKGLFQFLMAIPKIFWIAKKAAKKADCWNLHAPDFGSFCVWFWAWFYKIPYMLELRGDQSMTPIYLKLRNIPFARLVASIMRMIMWFQNINPLFVVSVSKSLVRDFPPHNKCPEYIISDNRIPDSWYGRERSWHDDNNTRTIVCVGRLEAQKNPLGTMKTLAILDNRGFKNWQFVWVGDGPLREKTQDLASELGISNRVNLMGFVAWDDVFSILDKSDLFLLNSVSEGLPRALAEGLARGLPAVGTDVGGIPELLDSEDIVPMMADEQLAAKLHEVLSDSNRLSIMSKRNLQTAGDYSAEVLSGRKIEFYKILKQELQKLKAG